MKRRCNNCKILFSAYFNSCPFCDSKDVSEPIPEEEKMSFEDGFLLGDKLGILAFDEVKGKEAEKGSLKAIKYHVIIYLSFILASVLILGLLFLLIWLANR